MPSPLVRGRAAEALGLIGAKDAAAAIGTLAAEYVAARRRRRDRA